MIVFGIIVKRKILTIIIYAYKIALKKLNKNKKMQHFRTAFQLFRAIIILRIFQLLEQ